MYQHLTKLFLAGMVAVFGLAGSANDSYSKTACDFVLGLKSLALPGEVIDHKTDWTDMGCTTQVNVKVDRGDSAVTKVDFKIDQACDPDQAQFTVISLEIAGEPPMTSCNVTYDNPLDPMAVVDEDTDLASVESLAMLIKAAADATADQFPEGEDLIADMLVADLDSALVSCPCWTRDELSQIADGGIDTCGATGVGSSMSGLDGGTGMDDRVSTALGFPSACFYQEQSPATARFLSSITPEEAGFCVQSIAAECTIRGF